MRLGVPGLGHQYAYVKAAAERMQSLEEDLRAVYAQYTEDETTIKLFQATRLAKLLPAGAEFTEPSMVEYAAYRFFVEAAQSLLLGLPEKAAPIYRAYMLVPVLRDIELIVRRSAAGQPPSRDELIWPGNPLVSEALRYAEEGVTEPAQILSRLGLRTAYSIVSQARTGEALDTALDAELMQAFADALGAMRSPQGRDLVGARLDITAAKVMHTLIEARPARQVLDIYLKHLATHRLPLRDVKDAIEAGDAELARKILASSKYAPLPEGLPALEAFIAKARKYARYQAKRIFAWQPSSIDPVAGLLELMLLDAEDAVVLALMAYSRQPKHRVAQLLSIA